MPEDTAADGRCVFMQSAMASATSEIHFQCGGNCYALLYVSARIPECTRYKIVKPLVDDHLYITSTTM